MRLQLENQTEDLRMCRSLLVALCLTLCIVGGCADVYEECAESEAGSFVASWDSCQNYVYCDGDDSLLGQCDDGEYFDPESGACDVAANVQCFLDQIDEPPVEEESDEDELSENEPQIDAQPTPPTMQTPVAVDVINVAPVVKPNCPFSDDPSQVILMPSNTSCTRYYLCYHSHAMEMHCTDQLHFNANTGQCDYPESAHCAVGSIQIIFHTALIVFFPPFSSRNRRHTSACPT